MSLNPVSIFSLLLCCLLCTAANAVPDHPVAANLKKELCEETFLGNTPLQNGTSAESPALTPGQLKTYFATAQEIARSVVQLGREHGMSWRVSTDAPHPHFSHIAANGGLAIEMFYGAPYMFWTPLGRLKLVEGEGNLEARKKLFTVLKERLGLVRIADGYTDSPGAESGSIYAVTQDLNGHSLPLPELTGARRNLPFQTYQAEKRLWQQIKPPGRD